MPDYFERRQNKRILKSEIKAFRHALKARGLSAEIREKERARDEETRRDAMLAKKKQILHQIDQSSSLFKTQWYQSFDTIDLESREADGELRKLLMSVELEIGLSRFNWRLRDEERNLEESALQLIKSSLDLLITLRNLYELSRRDT